MVNKQDRTISIKLSTAILIIISIIAIIVIGIIYFSKKNNKEDKKIVNNNVNNQVIENKTSNKSYAKAERVNLDINDVQEIYEYIPATDLNQIQENVYQNKRMIIKDLSDDNILMYAFNNLDIDNINKKQYDANTPISKNSFSFDEKILQDNIKKLYGEEVNIQNKSFDIGFGAHCEYRDNKYYYTSSQEVGQFMMNIRKIIKAYEEGNETYIIDEYMLLTSEEDNYKIYSDSSLSNLLKEYEKDSEEAKKITSISNDELSDYIIDNNKDLMKKYKHTFRKNSNGKYYWYSTEPFEE